MTAGGLDQIFTDTIARHFAEAKVEDGVIRLGFGGLEMRCHVPDVKALGDSTSVSLFMNLSGGALGPEPIFMSASGYGENPEVAVVTGGCNWACTFGPIIRAGLGGEEVPNTDRASTRVMGRTMDVFVAGLDRVFTSGPSLGSLDELVKSSRTRLGGGKWLTERVLASSWSPVVDPDRPSIVSVFVGDRPDGRIVEVKINGCDWPAAARAFGDTPAAEGSGVVLLRELAIVAPAGEPVVPVLDRRAIELILEGFSLPIEGGRAAADWPGYAAHRSELLPPLGEAEVAELERELGPLPGDYRRFLLQVARGGAGPGYGILSPLERRARAGAPRTFTEEDGRECGDVGGVLLLAEAGCGVYWVLVLRGESRGEVWALAFGSDHRSHFVAPSFTRWYIDWLGATARNRAPWIQWDGRCCATPGVISQMFEHLEKKGVPRANLGEELAKMVQPGAMAISTAGDLFHASGSTLAPCQGCVHLAGQLGLPASTFLLPGQESSIPKLREDAAAVALGQPLPSAEVEAEPEEVLAKKPWWKRFFG